MEKIIQRQLFTFMMLLMGIGFGFAQCPTGDLVFNTQQSITNFGVNYPNCTHFNGSILIDGAGITNLDGLSSLQSVSGSLSIEYCSSLTDTSGLSSLETVGGLVFYNNDALTNLNSLSSLTSVSGTLQLYHNDLLNNLMGLSSLQNVGILSIQSNYALTNLNGLSALENLGVLSVTATSLTNLDGLTSLESLESVFISNNASLVNMNGLNSVESIAGILNIKDNLVLNNLGLTSLQTIGGSLDIRDNTKLGNLNSFSSLSAVGSAIILADNAALSSVSGLANVDPNSFDVLQIVNNPNLSICNLPNFCNYLSNPSVTHPRTVIGNATNCATDLEIITSCISSCPLGDLNFTTQQQIDDFGEFYPSCDTFAGSVTVSGTSINNLEGLQNLETIQGWLTIQETGLTNLNGFENLTTIVSNVLVVSNQFLTSFDGLNNLNHVENLQITGNPALSSLHGLNNLTTLGTSPFLGGLFLEQNISLTDISAVSSISISTIGQMRIANNSNLSYCHIAGVCSFIDLAAVNGCEICIEVSNNLGSCNSKSAIANQCNTQQPISLIGTATEGGNTIDYDMITGDGIHYYLLNVFLAGSSSDYWNEYRIAFRKDHNWSQGSTLPAFPSGVAVQGDQNTTFVTTPGYYNVLFNIQTGAYSFTLTGAPPAIGVLGTSLNGCEDDINMQIRDGKNYVLFNRNFTAGDAKFRQDASWTVNWGATGFPTAFGSQDGVNIPINQGNYSVLFNRISGSYQFVNANYPCPSGLLYFQRQQNIDDFGIVYPHCTAFNEGIMVNGSDITQLDGLQNLTSVAPFLSVFDNPQLTNINGFSDLANVAGTLTISNNAMLTDIAGIQNANPNLLSGLNIFNNANLSVCNLPNVCTYMSFPQTYPRVIYGNAGNCVSMETVEDACGLGIEDATIASIKLYPNPVKDVLYFSEMLSSLQVYSIEGKRVFQAGQVFFIEVNNLLSGVYMIKAETANGKKINSKFIKQ